MSKETMNLAIHRMKDAIRLLSSICNAQNKKWHMFECYYRTDETGEVLIDDIILKEADKTCRRRLPRITVEGKLIDLQGGK